MPLGISPPRPNVFRVRPARRFSLSCRFGSCCNTIRVQAHVGFGEHKCPLVPAFVKLLKNSSAQQRQFLQGDMMPSREGEIRPNRKE